MAPLQGDDFRNPKLTGPRASKHIPSGGLFSAYSEVKINAHPSIVYDALLNVGDYKEWNSFVYDVKITKNPNPHGIRDGAHKRITGGSCMIFYRKLTDNPPYKTEVRQVVTLLEKLKLSKEGHQLPCITRVRWQLDNAAITTPGFLMRNETINEIEEVGDGTTVFRTWSVFSGPVAKIVRKKLEEPFRDRTQDMCRDLKEWCERKAVNGEASGKAAGKSEGVVSISDAAQQPSQDPPPGASLGAPNGPEKARLVPLRPKLTALSPRTCKEHSDPSESTGPSCTPATQSSEHEKTPITPKRRSSPAKDPPSPNKKRAVTREDDDVVMKDTNEQAMLHPKPSIGTYGTAARPPRYGKAADHRQPRKTSDSSAPGKQSTLGQGSGWLVTKPPSATKPYGSPDVRLETPNTTNVDLSTTQQGGEKPLAITSSLGYPRIRELSHVQDPAEVIYHLQNPDAELQVHPSRHEGQDLQRVRIPREFNDRMERLEERVRAITPERCDK
ncbi:uncharacterized protein LTR77_008090 [Saxophila tyrrhenica]|uniref:Uncharacterized protein n=1 Tax=Saxophila tyrrhenica TaxID=1690608 RepID=A0AAV9P293_9PEZI|nr:hypothetical protein LTR77_008090 [Saxophila tyrrhenica]